MPPALRASTLPPRSPRVPSFGQSSSLTSSASTSCTSSSSSSSHAGSPSLNTIVLDPAPEHLRVPAVHDGDVAEAHDLDTEDFCSSSHSGSSQTGNGNENQGSSNSISISSCSNNSSSVSHSHVHSKIFSWRGKTKVSSTDVASVGNASDTGIQYNKGSGTVVSTTGRALHERAKLALNAGNYALALELFTAILEAQIKRFGSSHASVAAAMHNVGVCRQRMGQYNFAENLLANAVAIRETTLGKYHVEVAASLSKLGSVRISLGKFEEAFVDLRKALQIAKTAAAADALADRGHSNSTTSHRNTYNNNNTCATMSSAESNKTVAQMLCHLACLYFEKGELFAAQATFQDALDIYRQVWSSLQDSPTFSSSSPVTTTTLNASSSPQIKSKISLMLQLTDTLCNIGSILNRRKCFDQAVSSFQEALDLQRGILEQDHPRIISTLDNLAYSYSKNKEYARAITCYRTMLRAQVSSTKEFSEDCLLTFRKRIVMYDKLKLTNEAINDTKDVLRLQKNYLPKDHPIVLETKALLEELQTKKLKESTKKKNGVASSLSKHDSLLDS